MFSLRTSSNSNSSSRNTTSTGLWQWVKHGRMSLFQVLFWTLASNAFMLLLCREIDFSTTYDGWSELKASAGAGGGASAATTTTKVQSPNYELALHHSLGYFDDIPADQWQKFFMEPARTAQHYENPSNPMAGWEDLNKWWSHNLFPAMECPHLIKLGGLLDGGKWVCDPERIPRAVKRRQQQQQQHANNKNAAQGCLVYSIGSNGNFLMETALFDMIGPVCEVHVFDFKDYGQAWHASKNIHYHPWGLKSSYATDVQPPGEGTFYSLPEMQRLLGHEGRPIDIFKIDCEICEWYSYKDWLTLDIRQILIETHGLPMKDRPANFLGANLPRLDATELFDDFFKNNFVLVSKEINTYYYNTADATEWTFLKMHPDFFTDPLPRS